MEVTEKRPEPTTSGGALAAYAAEVAAGLTQGASGSGSLVDLVTSRLDWVEVSIRRLAARAGRQDALMCPRAAGGFLLVVDPDLSPADIEAGRDQRGAIDWRVAHELGHTFFFTGDTPKRWVRWSPDEETEADRFALLLLDMIGTRR